MLYFRTILSIHGIFLRILNVSALKNVSVSRNACRVEKMRPKKCVQVASKKCLYSCLRCDILSIQELSCSLCMNMYILFNLVAGNFRHAMRQAAVTPLLH